MVDATDVVKVKPPGPGLLSTQQVRPAHEMLGDHVIRIAGREAVALDQHLALRVQERQLRREAQRMDLRNQELIGGRVEGVLINRQAENGDIRVSDGQFSGRVRRPGAPP